jgi:hypothetical protein
MRVVWSRRFLYSASVTRPSQALQVQHIGEVEQVRSTLVTGIPLRTVSSSGGNLRLRWILTPALWMRPFCEGTVTSIKAELL